MDNKIGPKKSTAGYDNKNNDEDNKEAMDDTDMESKAPCKTEWDMMWDNRGSRVWAPDYREHYYIKDAECRFYAVPDIMDRMNVSNYVYLDIDVKLR